MILLLLGTNGSGKSTIVKKILAARQNRMAIYKPDRRKPIGYKLIGGPPLFVLGHYEIQNGGLDTMTTEMAFQYVREYAAAGSVFFEGNRAASVRRLTHLCELFPRRLHVIHLTTPVDECISWTRKRGHNLNEQGIRDMAVRIENALKILDGLGLGVKIEHLPRRSALIRVKDLTGRLR